MIPAPHIVISSSYEDDKKKVYCDNRSGSQMSNQRMKQTEIAKVTLVHNDRKHFEEDQEVNGKQFYSGKFYEYL